MSSTRREDAAPDPTDQPDQTDSKSTRDTINIPDNVLIASIKSYAQPHQDDLLWMFGWATAEAVGRERLCDLLDCDWSTLYRISTGTYGAAIDSFMQRVADLRRRVTDSGPTGFIETLVTRKVFDVLDYALAGDLDGGKIVLISGPTRRGKSVAVREWARLNNHGAAVYIDCPESGGLSALFHEIATRCRVGAARKTVDLRDRLIASFGRRRILILDEVARLLPSRDRGNARELEFIRRLHDVQHCAVALVCTPVFPREMASGWLRDYLEQLLGRIAEPLYIPERVYKSEVAEILKAFNPDPAPDLVALAHRIANEPGRLGVLFELLRQAAALAKRKKEPLNERHLSAAAQRRRNRYTWPEES